MTTSRTILIALTVLFLACPATLRSEESRQPDFTAIDTYLRSHVEKMRIPGLAAAYVKDGSILFCKGYGQASPGRPVTPKSQFYIGSLTKSFTAIAALKLVEEGRLDLDTPVQHYLPWFQVEGPDTGSRITVRHLLNHTSGLSENTDPHAQAYTASLEEQARLMRNARPTETAGTAFQYYNQNYRLLGLIIETVSKTSYADYLKKSVLTPVGMDSTVADPARATDLCRGHTRVFGFALPCTQTFIPGALPSGYLISSAEDMARYLIAQLGNTRLDGQPLLQPETLATMRTPPAGLKSDYAMGWMVLNNGSTLIHGGDLHNFNALVKMDLSTNSGAVMLINQNSIENMLLENASLQKGFFDLLDNRPPPEKNYSWVGWLLLALAALDLMNQLRLYSQLPRWLERNAAKPRWRVLTRVLIGLVLPLTLIFGLQFLMITTMGGATWGDFLKLSPDLTAWLLTSLGMTFIRNVIRASLLILHKQRMISGLV